MDFSNIDIGDYLKRNGIKPSYQRIKVFEYLIKNRNHPTVDMIYNSLVSEIPTLSRTTVYNILKLFIKNNITQLISIEDNETRYDADTSVHGHFKCSKCGEIYDFPIDLSQLSIRKIDNFIINEKHIYFKGICVKCQKKNNE